MKSSLVLRAGPGARELIETDGLRSQDVKVMPGAAGGPKWLALAGLDRFLFGHWFAGRTDPLHTIGSSIATWRFTAAAQHDPVAAINRFEEAYLCQPYSPKPDAAEISRACVSLLDTLLPAGHEQQVLEHAFLRPHIITALCTGAAASESPRQLKAALARIALSNVRARHGLAQHVQRVIFHTQRDHAPFLPFRDSFTTHEVGLQQANLRPALMASASIPLVMEGVRDIPGAPAGMHRDGGLIDYHMDLNFRVDQGLVLFPHFSTRIVPGWLDKFLPWRKPQTHHLDRVLLIAPSDELLARLPDGKIPDRRDFARCNGDLDALYRHWRRATLECRRMADELEDLLARDQIASRLEAFP